MATKVGHELKFGHCRTDECPLTGHF